MFASTRPRDAAAPSRAGFAGVPLLAVCCLLFILFAIASTIVLALIPIYLPRKDAGALAQRDTLFFVLASRANLGYNGALDAASARSLADAVAAAQGLPAGSLDLSDVQVTSPTGRRRRRNNLKRRVRQNDDRGGSRLFCRGRRNRNRCGECTLVSIRVEIEISFVFFGTRITIKITIEIVVDLSTLLALLGGATGGTTPQVTDTSTTPTTTSSAAPATTPSMGG